MWGLGLGFGVLKLVMNTTSILVVVVSMSTMTFRSAEAKFNCSSGSGGRTSSCNALIDYVSPNSTNLLKIQTLFGVKKFQSLLGANNFPISTPLDQPVDANHRIKIPFPCLCANGTGVSNRRPVYKVQPDDGLDHIARDVFSGLVTYQQIQEVNNIINPDRIEVGQELWIPLPCSCDQVEGHTVVHYGHVVAAGSTVDGIAHMYNTSSTTLLTLNGLATPNDLMAGSVLHVPLKACTSMVADNSLDYPLLVANNTYVFTANGCVTCKCDAARNWTLQCDPSNARTSDRPSCPAAMCQGAEGLYLGNTTSISSCNRTTCAYAGYMTNKTILTTLAVESTCPVRSNSAAEFHLRGWSWNMILVAIHLVVLASLHLHLHQ